MTPPAEFYHQIMKANQDLSNARTATTGMWYAYLLSLNVLTILWAENLVRYSGLNGLLKSISLPSSVTRGRGQPSSSKDQHLTLVTTSKRTGSTRTLDPKTRLPLWHYPAVKL